MKSRPAGPRAPTGPEDGVDTPPASTLRPADIVFEPGRPPRSAVYGDWYHPEAGAAGQAQHVFLRGNGLPPRWQGRDDFVVLETGFGLGHGFLALWGAWRADPARCRRLHVVSVEAHPARPEDLTRTHAGSPEAARADELVRAWPGPVAGFHLLEFEGGALRLLLVLGDATRELRRVRARVDAFFLDGFAPSRNPAMWSRSVFQAVGRLAAPGATAATWSAARVVREGLATAGFEVDRVPGFEGKRDMCQAWMNPTAWVARSPRRPAWAVLDAQACAARQVLIVGAGLAGAASARALARAGWHCTVLDRHDQPAAEASGNPAGVFHAEAASADHLHARLLRSAGALCARRLADLMAAGEVAGAAKGLVHRGVHDPQGGWVDPRQLAQAWLRTPGVQLLAGSEVHALDRSEGTWMARGAQGQVLARAPLLVLAGGVGLSALGTLAGAWLPPLQPVRGQLSWIDFREGAGNGPGAGPQGDETNFPGPGWPTLPQTGSGYAVARPEAPPAAGWRLLFGATSQTGDTDPRLRESDHAYNLQRLHALTGLDMAGQATLQGRVGWRCVSPDRLPLVGRLPCREAMGAADTPDRPAPWLRLRDVPRIPGLRVIGALGARGITWAPMLAELLTAEVAGTPLPWPAEHVDALDPARGLVRQARRRNRPAGSAAASGA